MGRAALNSDLVIETRQGRVQGESEGAVRKWLGVPYAEAQRFAAPSPPTPWEGVRQANAHGQQCPQGIGKRTIIEPPDAGEDCLVLNIWSPAAAAHDGKPRPVLFWIHGGAFMAGSVNTYNGAELAERGDMLVVGVNYRVGVLGFTNFRDALGMPSIPTNLGIRDQIAALKWVHENIAAFGGDPARVTICGQSAGSMSVSLLMLIPEAWPYFSAAIMQSGALSLIHDKEKSVEAARAFAEILDVNQGDLEKLRAMDVKQLLAAQSQVHARVGLTIPTAPWYDGELLPASLRDAHQAPTAPVPLMAGATRQETRLFELLPGPDLMPMKRADLAACLRAQLPADQAEAILAAYPETKAGTTLLATDFGFFMPTRNFAERHAAAGQPTWFYRFDYSHFIAGAAHGLDLAFMWPLYGPMGFLIRGGPRMGKRLALADLYKANIISFARDHQPSPDWPRYTPETRQVLLYDKNTSVVADPERVRREAWAGKDVGAGLTTPFG